MSIRRTSPLVKKYAALYYERRRAKGTTQVEAAAVAKKPLYFASLMVGAGDADGSVGGAVNSTAETVRAALHAVGVHPRARLVSSVFIMALQDRSQGHNGLIAFADCAVVIEPNAMQMADIAIATAESTRVLIDAEPVVALLSFSTKGSGKGPMVNKVVEAMEIVRARAPELNADGELQADAAVDLVVGKSKAPGSKVAGRANTLVFPEPGIGQYRLQAGGAVGRGDGHRAVSAGAGEAGQRSFARLLGGGYFQCGGGDGAAIGDGLTGPGPCCLTGWFTTNATICTWGNTSFQPRNTAG